MQKQVKDVELEVRPCQHLRGTKYDEYILRTQTRTLGGVSVEFRARVVRQLFLYKPFAPLGQQTPKVLEGDSDVESADEEVSVRHEVPADGNKKTKQAEWTKVEVKAHDEAMKAYAKWEVNYGGRYILSRRCRRTTTNASEICDECELITKDLSFQEALRRVSCMVQIHHGKQS